MAISIKREITEKVNPPRTVFLRWPFGHPLGRPGDRRQQLEVISAALKFLEEAKIPGMINDLRIPWRRKRRA